MSKDTKISVSNVSMQFNLNRDKNMGLKEYVVKMLKRQLDYDEFWALRNISFEVRSGEVVGIMGLNGSGKSTLLKLIAGVFNPTEGQITVNGEIAPLLELGTGFDPEFSARDNIYMNGAMFGHSPTYMDGLFDEIIQFAELEAFADVPMKNFSSGMHARLGFAVATSVKPDILILDEILGVGDFKFNQKCQVRIKEMLSGGATVLLVSHSAGVVRDMCDRAILINKGELVTIGKVNDVCDIYEKGQV